MLDAALRCFDKHGMRETTLERIAKEADVPYDVVLAKYPSRDYVAQAIISRILDTLPSDFEDEVAPDATLRERLYAMIAQEFRLMEPHKYFMRDLIRESMDPFSVSSVHQIPHIQRYVAIAADQIAIARTRGEISPMVQPALAASAFWLLHMRVINFWLRDRSTQSAATHANTDKWLAQFIWSLGGREVYRSR